MGPFAGREPEISPASERFHVQPLAFRRRRGMMGEGVSRMRNQQVRMACDRCGSPRVTRDAWAEWSTEAQEWVLGTLFDHAFCHACERKARIVERPLED